MTPRISLVAVCCSSDSVNSLVRSSTLCSKSTYESSKLLGHSVEFIGEHFDFVAGFKIQAMSRDRPRRFVLRLHEDIRTGRTTRRAKKKLANSAMPRPIMSKTECATIEA